jgi:S1-C subfamily serine protease
MRRPSLYSSSNRSAAEREGAHTQGVDGLGVRSKTLRSRLVGISLFARHDPRALWLVIGLLSLALMATLWLTLHSGVRQLTQDDIDAAVLKTLESNVLPSAAAKAYETILPSVVRVTSYVKNKDGDEDIEQSVGTGVVIVDKGIILTNLHVVQGAETIKVVFADGLESTASVKSTQESDDLAVLQAHKIPDDLHAATMRSTTDLAPGDQVLAVGFPFGIGPSASAGIVSGLKRVFRSPQGNQEISNLIQFDAAANPGNSGGPLVTMDGQVVGIVTAILNPGRQRTFIGIGFAVPIENAASAVGLHPF